MLWFLDAFQGWSQFALKLLAQFGQSELFERALSPLLVERLPGIGTKMHAAMLDRHPAGVRIEQNAPPIVPNCKAARPFPVEFLPFQRQPRCLSRVAHESVDGRLTPRIPNSPVGSVALSRHASYFVESAARHKAPREGERPVGRGWSAITIGLALAAMYRQGCARTVESDAL